MSSSPDEVAPIFPGVENDAPEFMQIYAELRRIAQSYFRHERPEHTLQPTALVNEACIRLIESGVQFQNRAHFFSFVAEIMRRLLIDHARKHNAGRRGGANRRRVDLDELHLVEEEGWTELLALDEALTALDAFDPRLRKIVDCRVFAGLSSIETAEVLGVSEGTVRREWTAAKAWLQREINNYLA